MELEIIKREWSGAHNDSVIESERLTQFEVMDGCPVKGINSDFATSSNGCSKQKLFCEIFRTLIYSVGESVPVRIYLSSLRSKLTPTYNFPDMKFAVRYFLNIVLVDEDERRYFKQSEYGQKENLFLVIH